jgi:hypothetical protein
VTTVAIGQRVPSSTQRRKSSASMLLLPLQSLVLHHAGLDLDRHAVFVMHALKERHRELTEAIVGKPSLVLIVRSAPRDGSMCPGQSRVESRSSATTGRRICDRTPAGTADQAQARKPSHTPSKMPQ